MINEFVKSRIDDAKRIVAELTGDYAYVSVLGSYMKTKRILVTTTDSSINDLDNECGFVIKV